MEMIFSLENIEEVVLKIFEHAQEKTCWCFYGNMGAGKTTLIKAVCKYLQVEDVVSSPTYSIVNEYYSAVKGTIKHMDWYRLKSIEEAMDAGVDDAMQNANLCLIEWPEKFPELLDENCFSLKLETFNNTQHRLIFL